jgi:hypothetical protein
MLGAIRQLTENLRLKDLIISNFIPEDMALNIERRAAWNQEDETWVIDVCYMYVTCMLHVCYMYVTCMLHVCVERTVCILVCILACICYQHPASLLVHSMLVHQYVYILLTCGNNIPIGQYGEGRALPPLLQSCGDIYSKHHYCHTTAALFGVHDMY